MDLLEIKALGELGITQAELWDMTPRTFANLLEGYEARERSKWERTRLMMWAALVPHTKTNIQITPADVLPLPWDKTNKGQKMELEEMERRRQQATEFWARLDQKKG